MRMGISPAAYALDAMALQSRGSCFTSKAGGPGVHSTATRACLQPFISLSSELEMALSSSAVPLPLRMHLSGQLLLLMILLLATTLAVDCVLGQAPAPAPASESEGRPADTWSLYYENAAIYLYGSTLSCSSGQIETNRTGGQLWCAAALQPTNCDGPLLIAKWGCSLNDIHFRYDVYKNGNSNLYYFQLRNTVQCINTHCGVVGNPLIQYQCDKDNTDQQFELLSVGVASGCAPYDQLFQLVQPSIQLGGYFGCVTTGSQDITTQMCNNVNYVEETQTFMIRPQP